MMMHGKRIGRQRDDRTSMAKQSKKNWIGHILYLPQAAPGVLRRKREAKLNKKNYVRAPRQHVANGPRPLPQHQRKTGQATRFHPQPYHKSRKRGTPSSARRARRDECFIFFPPFRFFLLSSLQKPNGQNTYLVHPLLPLDGREVRRDAVPPPQLPRDAPARNKNTKTPRHETGVDPTECGAVRCTTTNKKKGGYFCLACHG